jgi:hypothetical protein
MTQAYYLSERDRQHLQELSRQVSRLRSELGARQVHTGGAKLGNAKWKNTHASTCPAGGIIKLSNIQLDSDSTGDYYYEGTRPDSSVFGVLFAVNGTEEVAENGYGSCTMFGYAFVNTSSFGVTHATDMPFGPVASSWLASRDGFTIGYLGSAGTCLSANILTPCVVEKRARKFYGTAKANWKKRGGAWPSAGGGCAYVEVDNVAGFATATEFKVNLPVTAGSDPNVVSGDKITFELVDGQADPDDGTKPYYVATSEYADEWIGSVKNVFGESAPYIAPGWVLADGTQDDTKTQTGNAYDMVDRFPLGADGNAITSSTTGNGTLTIDDADIATALANHGAGTGIASGTNLTPSHTGSGTNIVLTHNSNNPVAGEDYVPKHRGVYFLERIDNAAN